MSLLRWLDKAKVLALVNIPKRWVGLDLQVYPPLKRGDVVIIDRRTAELMERNGWVRIL